MSKKMKKPPLGLVLDNAKNLRRNMTDAEKLMWRHLRDRRFENLKFRRQHPIPPYIADFFCEELNMVIELDGGQHDIETDQIRSDFLKQQGFIVLRFWNNDILSNIEGVLMRIKNDIPEGLPLTPALSQGERVL